ncbi:MAG: D-alanine--D-alanine ligase [Bdellovibrionales bacterium]|nr:D-alanine--D-alanine ligase [Bdellovibrionales bacterium]
MAKKIRVAVIYGGKSGEHEVSQVSAASVIRHLDPKRFEPIPVSVDKEGKWNVGDTQLLEGAPRSLPVFADRPEVFLPPYEVRRAEDAIGPGTTLMTIGEGGGAYNIDVVFPVIHGTNGEDGTIQGLFELAGIPYVGCGVLSSAVGMDKDVAKRLARDAGIPVVPYICLKGGSYQGSEEKLRERVGRELGFPVFVKPSNAGSSVGVHKVTEASALKAAIDDSFRFDTKVLIEKAINAREIELSALESLDPKSPPRISIAGEITPTHEFYSYEAKYVDENGAKLKIPADLTDAQMKQAQDLARDVFVALECEGMARVDLFLDKKNGVFYLNEINTIPGFTHISMYPKLWEASGLSYRDLLTELIDLAIARFERKKGLVRDFSEI